MLYIYTLYYLNKITATMSMICIYMMKMNNAD